MEDWRKCNLYSIESEHINFYIGDTILAPNFYYLWSERHIEGNVLENLVEYKYSKKHYLYITTNEKPKVGDYVLINYEFVNKSIAQIKSIGDIFCNIGHDIMVNSCKKIIATNDASLGLLRINKPYLEEYVQNKEHHRFVIVEFFNDKIKDFGDVCNVLAATEYYSVNQIRNLIEKFNIAKDENKNLNVKSWLIKNVL